MQCFMTALALVIILLIVATEARSMLAPMIDFRRILPPDLPPVIRRLMWQQFMWIAFPLRHAAATMFWLIIAFLVTCQLAHLVMSA